MENKEKRYYLLAIIGAVICFVGDNLLGYYKPATDFGNKLLFINFSYDWAKVNPKIFALAGFCGVVSLLMMFVGFYGGYLRLKKHESALAKVYLLGSFVFVCVGTMYHNVFAIVAYVYNRLENTGFSGAKELVMEVFNTFILVGALAAVGYGIVVTVMFAESLRGNIYPKKWMCILNPFVFMAACIILSKVLPQTALVNGVFNLGQQSVGLFITFILLYATTSETE